MPYTPDDQWWPEEWPSYMGPPWVCQVGSGTVQVDQHGIGSDSVDYAGQTLVCAFDVDGMGGDDFFAYEFPSDPPPDPGDDDGDGDGDGDPVEPSIGQQVADFLGQGDDPAVVALAGEVVPLITVMVKAYTRDNGFTGNVPNEELSAVITTASARLVANPEQLDSTVGNVGVRGGFAGWNLAETFVLNRYRKRAI